MLDKFLAHLTYIKFYFSVKLDYEDWQGITGQNRDNYKWHLTQIEHYSDHLNVEFEIFDYLGKN